MVFAIVGIILNSQFSIPNSASAQQPWTFGSIEEACAADAFVLQPPADLRSTVESSARNAKFKPQKAAIHYNTVYHLSGPYRNMGRKYVRFQTPVHGTDSTDFYIPYETATHMLPHLVSTAYWQQRFSSLLRWTHVRTDLLAGLLDVDTAATPPSHPENRTPDPQFAPLHWLGYTYQPSAEWPVVFTVATNTDSVQTLSLRALQRLAEWGAFATVADHLAYERHEAGLNDSLVALDSHLTTIDSQFSILNSQLSTLIDSITQVLRTDSIEEGRRQTQQQVRNTLARMDRDAIFLFSAKHARSDYMFGLEFNFYNCFPKTITKIEVTVVPYNDRGGIQPDKFNRTARTVRCMGPISKGQPASYRFDELFWNDHGRIKYMRTTNVTFHFADGTTRTFSGYAKIRRHTLSEQ